MPLLDRTKTVFFLCDVQVRFRDAIHGFDEVVHTANKMLKIAKVLGCHVVATEQNPTALGPTVPEIDLSTLGPLYLGTVHKTLFSMLTTEILDKLYGLSAHTSSLSIVLFGIESHVCVLQTALELLDLKFTVYVLADGVSSCNKEEVPIALDYIRQAGGHVTTSESLSFQLMRDASDPAFKTFAAVVKGEKESTKKALECLTSTSRSLL